MTDQTFSATVLGQWIPGAHPRVEAQDSLRVLVDESLPANRSLMILEVATGGGFVWTTPNRAAALGFSADQRVDLARVRSAAAAAGLELHDPDHLFYLPVEQQHEFRTEAPAAGTRGLTGADAQAFAEFAAAAPAADLEEAFVELDHWLVFGTLVDDRIVAVATMYPWDGTRLADLGVLTLPSYRGNGLARRTVRALAAAAVAAGYEPQYRCQLDNTASVALAASAGFVRFGTWHVISQDA